MQRQVQTQTKLKRLQAKYEAEEMKEVRQVPQINEMSRLIAMQNSEKSSNFKSKYISSILSNSRFVKQSRAGPAHNSIVKNAVIKLEDSDELAEPFESYKNQNSYLFQLRDAMNHRPQVNLEENRTSLLEMGVVERGKLWISQRIEKLQKLKEKLKDESLEKCTFAPVISPGVRVNSKSSRAMSVCNSYSQLYQLKKNRVVSPGRLGANFFEKHQKPKESPSEKSFLLKQLSPSPQKVSFSAGGDLDRIISYSKLKNN
jgi:hypothetical protein